MTERRVRDVMTRTVVAADEDTPFKELVALLAERKVAALPVVNAAHEVVGVVSASDLLYKEEFHDEPRSAGRRRLWRGWPTYKAGATEAREVMTAPAVVISADATIVEAARRLDEYSVKRLPVVDADGRLVGIVAPRDILKVFLRPDAEIRQEIIDTVFVGNLHADPALITVEVREGVAVLGGEVEASSQIEVAVRMAAAVDGVVAVRDRLTAAGDRGKECPA
ncbi:MAG TPA: CBS domain-containing protein [Streptosporangiaceae bacterium]